MGGKREQANERKVPRNRIKWRRKISKGMVSEGRVSK
jgi:hypothetical protein